MACFCSALVFGFTPPSGTAALAFTSGRGVFTFVPQPGNAAVMARATAITAAAKAFASGFALADGAELAGQC